MGVARVAFSSSAVREAHCRLGFAEPFSIRGLTTVAVREKGSKNLLKTRIKYHDY